MKEEEAPSLMWRAIGIIYEQKVEKIWREEGCDEMQKQNDFNDKTQFDRRMDQIVTVPRVPLKKIENGSECLNAGSERDCEGEISEIWRLLKWEENNTCEKLKRHLE